MSRIAGFLQTVRPEIQGLPRYNAGLSIDYVRQHYRPAQISKLGSNENSYGPSPRVIAAITAAAPDVWLYPEPLCDGLRAELAARLAVDPELLIFGNGSEDLIAIAVHTFLAPGSDVVTFAPSFGLHIIYPQSVGADVRVLQPRADYTMNAAEVAAALTPCTRMLIFGNPSNPSGASLTAEDLRTILAAASPETLIIFDEAYLEYARADPAYPDFHAILRESASPWLILRTFSKAYGLAGLRVGYAIASDPELIHLMDRVRTPFNVNRLAQVATIAAIGDPDYVEQSVARTIAERTRIRAALEGDGFVVAPSLTNFLFVRVHEESAALAEGLLRLGVIVKPWREPGFTDHIRITIGDAAANDHMLQAFRATAVQPEAITANAAS